MDEIKPKDVLRLFFGKEHKHYLVNKVGKHSLKLKNEYGLVVSLKHTDGKLEQLGDAVITGFQVLRDPNRYSHYNVGAEVSVRTHDGKAFKGDILENDDGLLKIKTDANHEWYVDLDAHDKVELLGSVVSDETADVKLPDEIDDLFFLNLRKESNEANRVYETFRTRARPMPAPFWIVPILDPNKCRLDLQEGDEVLYTKAGKAVLERTEAVLFNQTVYGNKVKETYGYAAQEKEELPIAEYALMVPLPSHAQLSNLNPNWGVRLFEPTPETKRFDRVQDAVAAFTPSVASATSSFEAELLLYPLPLREEDVERLAPPKKVSSRTKEATPYQKRNNHVVRSTLAAAYKGQISESLTPSESLARMFAIDYGNAYFKRKKGPSSLRPSATDKNWALEQLGQRLKKSRNSAAYAKEAVAIVNELYFSLHTQDFAQFLRLVQQYGRLAKDDENKAYVYFSPPVYSKYALVPCAAEQLARMGYLRGNTGLKTVLDAFVEEDGLLLDRTSGLVYTNVPGGDADWARCTREEIFPDLTYTEEDLILLNLAGRLARELGLRIPHELETSMLNAVRIDGRHAYKNAVTIAAFLAYHGKIAFGVAAEALRKAAKRKVWSAVQESKELTADVAKAAAKLASKKTEVPGENTPLPFVPKLSVESTPAFERIVAAAEPRALRSAASEPVWTVLPQVKPKDYHFLADVFAPDRTAVAAIEHCTPVVMAVLAPSEKSFFKHVGEVASERAMYEFVSNLAMVVPNLLISGRKAFEQDVLPVGSKKKNAAFMKEWKGYYAALLALGVSETSNDVTSRFAMNYALKAATFHRLVAVAKTALLKRDEEMLQACAVRAAFLHLSENISEELEAYVVQIVRVCIEMFRRDVAADLTLLEPAKATSSSSYSKSSSSSSSKSSSSSSSKSSSSSSKSSSQDEKTTRVR